MIRPLVSVISYFFFYRNQSKKKRVTAEGESLKAGISYCLVAKNEEDTIDYCFKSLIGFADQVICIDNGSSDSTLNKMIQYKEKMNDQLQVIVLSMPDSNLMECRQECLRHVKHTWFMRGDADFIITDDFRKMKPMLMKLERPSAVSTLALIPFGDLSHFSRFESSARRSEYFMRSYENDILYHEFYGRLEHAVIPIYYKLIEKNIIGLLHWSSNKSNERIFFRTCYLDHRQFYNEHQKQFLFSDYQSKWTYHIFETEDATLLKYRMARLIAQQCKRMPAEWLKAIPQDIVGSHAILYRDGVPFLRLRNEEINDFSEEQIKQFESLGWKPDAQSFYTDSLRRSFEKTLL